jgi:hypothetical protein
MDISASMLWGGNFLMSEWFIATSGEGYGKPEYYLLALLGSTTLAAAGRLNGFKNLKHIERG